MPLALILVVPLLGLPSASPAADFLTLCDGAAATDVCRSYLRGFTDAMTAYRKFLERWRVRPMICVPAESLDRERLRQEALRERRLRPRDEWTDDEVLLYVIGKLYPCPRRVPAELP